jgi:hypothetical protein
MIKPRWCVCIISFLEASFLEKYFYIPCVVFGGDSSYCFLISSAGLFLSFFILFLLCADVLIRS